MATCQRCDPALPRFHVSLMGAFSAPEPHRGGGLLGCFPARARAWFRASKHPKSWLCAPKLPKPEIESVPLYTKLVFEAPRLNPWSVFWPHLHYLSDLIFAGKHLPSCLGMESIQCRWENMALLPEGHFPKKITFLWTSFVVGIRRRDEVKIIAFWGCFSTKY